jgi:membrane protein required for beta-lactamase induction
MIWQDLVMSGCGILFAAAFIPQIVRNAVRRSCNDFSYTTILMTVIPLLIMALCQQTLNLYLSAASTSITASMWIMVLLQKYGYRNNGR